MGKELMNGLVIKISQQPGVTLIAYCKEKNKFHAQNQLK
tara:strand:- start:367 stop:483 length:117 start_codon:yes stop_codon:yes gene_type:complete